MNAGEVIRWWEGRRFFFNSVVGCTGVITCVLLIVCAFTAESSVGEPIGMPDGPLLGVFGIVFYGILANVFYTGGWISELLMRAVTTTEKASAFGRDSSPSYAMAHEIVCDPQKVLEAKKIIDRNSLATARRAAEQYFYRCAAESISRGYHETEDETAKAWAGDVSVALAG